MKIVQKLKFCSKNDQIIKHVKKAKTPYLLYEGFVTWGFYPKRKYYLGHY
jgi:hypothetical protein